VACHLKADVACHMAADSMVDNDAVCHMAADVAADLDDSNDVDNDVEFLGPMCDRPYFSSAHISAQNFSPLKSIQPTKNTHHI
jgi:hypothetical protein